jgi:hypothetical protein
MGLFIGFCQRDENLQAVSVRGALRGAPQPFNFFESGLVVGISLDGF